MKRAVETVAPVVIHETAIVHPSAELDHGVEVQPFAIVGPGVRIGANTHVGPRVLIEKDTLIGTDCRLANGAVLGTDPQDLKYEGQKTLLRIGDRTVVREYATLNRGTAASGQTLVGSDCLLMAYSHIAHDCELGNHVIVANATNMGGHVTIEDWATVSGLVAIHQFVRVGAHAFVGGGSRIPQDVPPYCRVVGNPSPKVHGLNSIGLERRGFSAELRGSLKRTYRILFQSGLNMSQAIERVEQDAELSQPEVRYFLDFIRNSKRGITS
jgi:UDP-N-acetylglucosamine acyltransferase